CTPLRTVPGFPMTTLLPRFVSTAMMRLYATFLKLAPASNLLSLANVRSPDRFDALWPMHAKPDTAPDRSRNFLNPLAEPPKISVRKQRWALLVARLFPSPWTWQPSCAPGPPSWAHAGFGKMPTF